MEPTLDLDEVLRSIAIQNPARTPPEAFLEVFNMFPDVTKNQVKKRMQQVRERLKAEGASSTRDSPQPPSVQSATGNDKMLAAMVKRMSLPRQDFISDAVSVQNISNEKGLGVIAGRRVLKGELLVKEKPLLQVDKGLNGPMPQGGNRRSQAAALAKSVESQFATLSSQDQEKLMSLHDAVTDKQKTVAGIYLTNATSRGASLQFANAGRGVLCATVSRFNHSCAPNAVFNWREHEGCESVVAVKDIDAGEEICVFYISLTEESSVRQAALREGYGFTCTCEVCMRGCEALAQSDKNRSLMKTLDAQIPVDSQAKKYDVALVKVDQLFSLAEVEKLQWYTQGRTAGDAFQLSTFAQRPAEERKKWCQLAIDCWTISHGEDDSDVKKYKCYMKKLPTTHQMMMQNMHAMMGGQAEGCPTQ